MKRALLLSLSMAAFGWMSGCGGGSGSLGNTPPTPNAFNGQYAFLLAGFDSNNNRVGIAGSIKADGLGHITAGEVDVNDNGTVSTNSSLSGTYAFDAAGQSTLGTITLTTTITGVAHPLGFGFSLQNSGDFGQIMSLDANSFVATGTVQLQTASAFSLSSMAADYIVTMNQRNATNPTSVLGRFTLGAGGGTTNLAFDRSVAGLGTAGPTTSPSLVFGSGGPDTNGRGTFTLSINDGLLPVATQSFAYYAITADRLIAVETDTIGGPTTADFARQLDTPTPFSASTAVTAGCVFGLSGVDATGTEITAVGQLQIAAPGAGSNTGALEWDSNDDSTVFGPANVSSQAVTFDPTTGRGTVTVTSGFAHGLADTVVFYLSAPGTGFILDATPLTSNRAMAGNFMPQSSSTFSAATDLAGLAIVRSGGASLNTESSLVGLFGPTTTTGVYALLFDQAFPNGTAIVTSQDQSVSPITVGTIDASGRGTLQIPNNGATSTYAFYIIGPNEFRFIDVNPNDGASPLFYASPD